MTALVVAPLQLEQKHFITTLYDLGYRGADAPIGPIPATRFDDLDLLVAYGGHGKTQFGVHTRHILNSVPELDTVLCVGTAGALASELAVADVVVGTSTVEHDYNQRFTPQPLPVFAGHPELLAGFRDAAAVSELPVHFGIVASGDEDVIEIERGVQLAALTGAMVVAWEGAGAARAAMLTHTPHLEIRAVSDLANHTAMADFMVNIGPAMANIAKLVLAWRSEGS
jgi:adenosylhomocysteine nucleosidase